MDHVIFVKMLIRGVSRDASNEHINKCIVEIGKVTNRVFSLMDAAQNRQDLRI